jgi:hypothetical protein
MFLIRRQGFPHWGLLFLFGRHDVCEVMRG